ncbi:hypothetical protein [Kordia jejudonensis]|uniref:hypothetical protein n=1 Tax=Kordia jejudonensis TaxID=1348245 RepID=UPI000629CD54|nr:hypothetical protein [Kordia jejudonensis]
MKKVILILIIIFILGCNSQKNTDESDIINLVGEEYLHDEYLMKLTENGVVFKQFENMEDINKILSEINKLKEITPLLKEKIFNPKEISHYLIQIDTIDFLKINFKNPKLRSYKSAEKEQNQYEYYKQTISKPLFSMDQNYAIVITSGSHNVLLKVFQKNKNNQWSSLGNFNVFPAN